MVIIFRVYYRYLVKKEVEICKITDKDKVLFIGGGPLPCTAMEIVCMTGAEVKVIDNDIKSVEAARRLVNTLGMSDCIKVEHEDGRLVDTKDYSVIHVAKQAHPQEQIFEHLCSTVSSGTRIYSRLSGEIYG